MKNNKENTIEAYLSFGLDNELFAVSVYQVLEVLETAKLTKIPRTPKYVKGVINFRGEVLPVIDLRMKFKMENIQEQDKNVIIVLELKLKGEPVMLGAIADTVRDVLNIDKKQIKPVPDFDESYDSNFITGMLKLEEGFIMLLDMNKVFSIADLSFVKKTAEALESEHDNLFGEEEDIIIEEEKTENKETENENNKK